MGKKNIKNQQEVVTYTIDECQHDHLEKLAINHYYCIDCGIIFHFILSQQMNYERAIEVYGNYFKGILAGKKKIATAQKKEEAREANAEKEAVKKYKEKRIKEVQSRSSKSN